MEVTIMIRYGELSTKGRNKKRFVQRLAQNIRHALNDFPEVRIHPEYDFMYLTLNGAPEQAVCDRLSYVFGIQSYAPVYRLPKDFETVAQAVVALLSEQSLEGKTFKIATKRSDHQYELDTNAMNRQLGAAVLAAYPQLTVRLKQPDIHIKVDIRQEAIVVGTQSFPGAGGLPTGSSGRGMLLLSGGIDSPVAGYLALKRGLAIEAIHFYSPPYTSPQALHKTKRLAHKLTRYGTHIQFLTVPFTEIQEAIKANVPEGYLMTITRRMMLRVADRLRQIRHASVLVNGESLGQVASQTVDNMVAINEVTTTPILRPLIMMDKLDIIAIAEAIDTFAVSIEPHEDCCTIFAPPSPKTKPKLEKVYHYEQRLNCEELVARAVAQTTVENMIATQPLEQVDDFSNLL